MTIKEVLDYVDRIKKNEFTDAEKIRWINEIEGYVQIQIMLLAQPECVSYYPASESDMSGIYFPSSNLMQLPRKLKAHVGGLISIEGLVSYPGNNLSGVEVLSISEDGRLIGVAEGTFIDIGTVPESAIAQLTFDGQETELLVPAPFERLYYEYVLCKISENLEESSAQNNRIATFEETWENFAEWYANNYTPATGSAEFKGYYITGKMGPPGPIGPPGENIYNITITDNSGVITADKTYAEIKAAAEKGMIIRLAGAYEGYTPSLMLTRVRSDGTVHLSGVCDNNITLVELFVESNETCHISITTLAPSEEVSKIDARLKRLEKGAKELIVTATASDNVGYTIDKTYGEIIEAMPCVMLKVVESDGSVIYCSDAQYDGSKVQFYDGTHSFQLEKYTVTSWSIGTDAGSTNRH